MPSDGSTSATDPATRTLGRRAVTLNNKRKIARKHQVLEPYLEGNVLHLGCIGPGPRSGQEWLHDWIADQTDRVVGLDTDADGVDAARAAGYDVWHGDAQAFDLDDEFATILATNIIEHLPCPGAMLDCAADHLAPGGQLVITTPRTLTLQNLARELRGGIEVTDAHVAWFCQSTLSELLDRHGYQVAEYDRWGYNRAPESLADAALRTVERVLSTLGWESVDDYQHLVVAEHTDLVTAGGSSTSDTERSGGNDGQDRR